MNIEVFMADQLACLQGQGFNTCPYEETSYTYKEREAWKDGWATQFAQSSRLCEIAHKFRTA